MKNNRSLNFAFVLMTMLGLAACSSSDSDNNTTPDTPNQQQQTTVGALLTDLTSEYQSTITNSFNAGVTRAGANGYTLNEFGIPTDMPSEPSVPSDAKELTADAPYADHSGNWVVPAGKTVDITGDAALNLGNMNLYIAGKLNLGNGGHWGAANIYILKGGKLYYDSSDNQMLKNVGCTIYNYGTFEKTSQGLYIANNEKLYNAGEIAHHKGKDFNVQGTFYTTGSMGNWASYSFQSGCKVNILGSLWASKPGSDGKTGDGLDIVTEGDIHVGGKVFANSMKMNGAGNFICDCSITVDGEINTNSTNNIYANYIKAGSMYQCSTAKIYLHNNGYINILGTYTNDNNGNDGAIVLIEDGKAVVHAKKFASNASGFSGGANEVTDVHFFQTPNGGKIYVSSNTWQFNDNAEKAVDYVNFLGNVEAVSQASSDDATAVTLIEKDDCHSAFKEKTEIPNPVKELDVISDQHVHDISATCVQSDGNGNVYLSFHQNGDDQSGCIEWLTTANDQTTLRQWVRDENNSIDFNHIALGNGKLYTVGNNKNGGFLGYMKLNNGRIDVNTSTIAGKTYSPLTMVRLAEAQEIYKKGAKATISNAGDGNAVVLVGNQLKVASTYGLEVFNADDSLTTVGTAETPGKGKHIAIGQNGTVYFSYFNNQNTDTDAALDLRITTVNSDNSLATPFNAGQVAPNNGKNVICEYDNKIYSAQGTNGLQVYDLSGNKVGEFVLNNTGASGKDLKICANGVTVDANYVYVAYGSRGLRVLDRSTLTQVAKYVCGRSANYVSLANGYIYVAYGRNNIKVFKLVDAK